MAIYLHNTLTKRKEELVPRDPRRVGMYVCGINTYDFCHVGHARAYVFFDVVRRFLEKSGYQVYHVQNFTDVEDNILERARETGEDWRAMGERFIQAYFQDMDALGVLRANRFVMATEHIPEMVELICALVEKGVGYRVDGDVYFEVRRFPSYGKLSGRSLDDLRPGTRVERDPRLKDPNDFILWKAAKPGEPSWESPWGPGRPGWHIECSAMALKHLGFGFDIHGGGQDLIFPHHEDEIAQAEAALGREPFVRYWMHVGWLTVKRQKMSKSLGNFFTIREVLERYRPQVLRLFLLSSHYHRPLEFSQQAMEEAKAALERLEVGLQRLELLLGRPQSEIRGQRSEAADSGPVSAGVADGLDSLAREVEEAEAGFRQAMEDDFNTARALACLFRLVGELHRQVPPHFRPGPGAKAALGRARQALLTCCQVLGISLEPATLGPRPALEERLLEILIFARHQARKKGDFQTADAIRSSLRDLGIVLEDHPSATTWRRG